MGRTCIVPEIGTVKDIEKKDCIFSYSYTTEEEHRRALNEVVGRAYDCYKADSGALKRMGETLLSELENSNGADRIGKSYKALYEKILAKK